MEYDVCGWRRLLTKILFVFSGSQFSLGAGGEIFGQCVNFVESTLEDLISPITLTNTTSSSEGRGDA